MTPIASYIIEAHAIQRAVRHLARGESAEKVLAVAPAESSRWVRNHPATYADMIACERRELAANGRQLA